MASLSELTQKRWAFLEDDGWKLFRVKDLSLAETSLPFLVAPTEKKILLFSPESESSPQDKAIEGAFAIAAVWQAYFRIRTTHAFSYRVVHPHFLNFAWKIFSKLPQTDRMSKALAERHRIAIGPSITNLTYQTTKVLEMERARALHLWLSLRLVENAFNEATQATRLLKLRDASEGPFLALLASRQSTLDSIVQEVLQGIPSNVIDGWDD